MNRGKNEQTAKKNAYKNDLFLHHGDFYVDKRARIIAAKLAKK